MATNARGQKTIDVLEPVSRTRINQLLDTVIDVRPTASATTQAQLVTDLVAAGQAPSQANPLYVYRQDTSITQMTADGTNWVRIGGLLSLFGISLSSWSSSLQIRQEVTARGFKMTLRGRLTRTAGSFTLDNSAYTGLGSAVLPPDMKPNVGPTDILASALAFPDGVTPAAPILFVLNTVNNSVAIRSPQGAQNWIAGGANPAFFQIEGVTWYRDL